MAETAPILASKSFQVAVDSFKRDSRLSYKEIQELEITTLEDLKLTISNIQNSQRMLKTQKYMRRLDPFIKAMKEYGTIIEMFIKFSDFVAFIWGPMKFLLITLSNFSDAFEALLEGYYRIGKSIPVLMQYETLLRDNEFLQRAMVPIYEHILEFHAEAVKYFKKKTWINLFQATWNRVENKIKRLSQALKQEQDFFSQALEMSKYKESQEFRRKCLQQLMALETDRAERQAEAKRIRDKDQIHQRERLSQFLGDPDSKARHQHLIEICHPGTGTWLLSEPKFRAWYEFHQCSDPLLWLSGKPGAGKTVLSSFVIEEIKKIPGAIVVYHYCRPNEKPGSGFVLIARSLISQIISRSDIELLPFYEVASKNDSMILSDKGVAKTMLQLVLQELVNVYIVIDGLDEYSREDRKDVSEWFKERVHSLGTDQLGSLRCMFVSQFDGPAKKDFSMLSHIEITESRNKNDIRSYVQIECEKIEKKFGSLDSWNIDLTSLITNRAKGMFLYARLVLRNLLEQANKRDLKQELEPDVLPSDLVEAYERILSRILSSSCATSRRKKKVLNLLGWLACMKRPCQWYEIQAAMSVDTENCTFEPDLRLVEDVKELCHSLVEINSDGSINLVHSTTKEFLIQRNHICLPKVDFDLAGVCLIYLNLPVFGEDIPEDPLKSSVFQGTYAFLEYAISFWGQHIESGLLEMYGSNDIEERFQLLIECLDTFLDNYWISEGPSKAATASKSLREHFQALDKLAKFEEALLSISTLRKAMRPLGKNFPLDEMLTIYRDLDLYRSQFESMVTPECLQVSEKKKVLERYGNMWFKCPRLNCHFFHAGFHTLKAREEHLARHERKFECSMEGCPQSQFGYASVSELEKHMLDGHGIRLHEEPDEFPKIRKKPSNHNAGSIRKPQDLSYLKIHRCPDPNCDREFTRASNLKSHLQVHTTDRPHKCKSCEAAFVRPSDKKRHEDMHTRKKARLTRFQ